MDCFAYLSLYDCQVFIVVLFIVTGSSTCTTSRSTRTTTGSMVSTADLLWSRRGCSYRSVCPLSLWFALKVQIEYDLSLLLAHLW